MAERNQAQLLVALQDLEDLVQQAENPDERAKIEEMGFPVGGLEDLRGALAKLESEVQPGLLNRYRRLRKRTGMAVIPVVDNTCTGCFTSVPHIFVSSVNAGKVINCETCGRMLYWP